MASGGRGRVAPPVSLHPRSPAMMSRLRDAVSWPSTRSVTTALSGGSRRHNPVRCKSLMGSEIVALPRHSRARAAPGCASPPGAEIACSSRLRAGTCADARWAHDPARMRGARTMIPRECRMVPPPQPIAPERSLRSARLRRRDVVVGRYDLPAPPPAHPRVGEPVAAVERAARAAPPDHKPTGDPRRRTESVAAHVLVVGGLHGGGAGDNVPQHRVAGRHAVVLGVDESLGEEPVEGGRVAPHEGRGPLVLEPQERAHVAILPADACRPQAGEQHAHRRPHLEPPDEREALPTYRGHSHPNAPPGCSARPATYAAKTPTTAQ